MAETRSLMVVLPWSALTSLPPGPQRHKKLTHFAFFSIESPSASVMLPLVQENFFKKYQMLMKPRLLSLVVGLGFLFARGAFATQADDTTITITGQNAGPTPFISQLTLTASDTSVIKN